MVATEKPMSAFKRFVKQLPDILRHPLTLAIIGSIVGSWLIPWVVGQSQRKAALAEARVKQGIEIMTTSNSVNVTVNKMKTAFQIFERHSLSTTGAEYADRSKELRKTIFETYGEFDSTAWWWPWNIYYQGILLHTLPDERQEKFKHAVEAYMANLTKTAELLGPPWDQYLSGNPDPAGKKPVMDPIDPEMRKLEKERNDLAYTMAKQFQ